MRALFGRALRVYGRHWLVLSVVCIGNNFIRQPLSWLYSHAGWGQLVWFAGSVLLFPLALGVAGLCYSAWNEKPVVLGDVLRFYHRSANRPRLFAMGGVVSAALLLVTMVTDRQRQIMAQGGPVATPLWFAAMLLAIISLVAMLRLLLVPYLLLHFPGYPVRPLLRESRRRMRGRCLRLFGAIVLLALPLFVSSLISWQLSRVVMVAVLPVSQVLLAGYAAECLNDLPWKGTCDDPDTK